MNVHLTKTQVRLLSVCVVLYTALYLCRLNLSAALDAMARDMELSMAAAGLLQTAFAVVYAAGQVVSGAVADRVNPYRHMLLGLCGSALCNLLMSAAPGYGVMIAAWTLNAVFQSMLWTPIVRIVALHFTGLEEQNAANAALAYVLIAGHLLAWAIAGAMAEDFGWRLSFAVPACAALATAGVCARFLPELRHGAAGRGTPRETAKAAPAAALLSAGFLLVLISCAVYGFIRDGVITWTPSILARIGRERAVSPMAFTLVLPVINAVGVTLSVWQRGRGANPRTVVVTMMAAAMVCCAALLFARGMLAVALLLGGVCAAMYGANTMLTGIIPLEFESVGRTGTTAGLIDACIYLGSALSGVLAGSIYERAGIGVLCMVWMVCCVAVGWMMVISGRKKG